MIAKAVCADFPDNYDFAVPVKKRMARLQADYENRPDVLRAVFAAEGDEMKSILMQEFPQASRTKRVLTVPAAGKRVRAAGKDGGHVGNAACVTPSLVCSALFLLSAIYRVGRGAEERRVHAPAGVRSTRRLRPSPSSLWKSFGRCSRRALRAAQVVSSMRR